MIGGTIPSSGTRRMGVPNAHVLPLALLCVFGLTAPALAKSGEISLPELLRASSLVIEGRITAVEKLAKEDAGDRQETRFTVAVIETLRGHCAKEIAVTGVRSLARGDRVLWFLVDAKDGNYRLFPQAADDNGTRFYQDQGAFEIGTDAAAAVYRTAIQNTRLYYALFDQQMHMFNVETHDGELWINSARGLVAVDPKTWAVKRWFDTHSYGYAGLVSAAGALFYSRRWGEMYRWSGGKWQVTLDEKGSDGHGGPELNGMKRDPKGVFWCVGWDPNRPCFTYDGKDWKAQDLRKGEVWPGPCAVSFDAKGRVWIPTVNSDTGVHVYDGSKWESFDLAPGYDFCTSVVEARGAIWACMKEGVYRFDGNAWLPAFRDPIGYAPYALAVDGGGGLWSSGNGVLYRCDGADWSAVSPGAEASICTLYPVVTSDGSFWAIGGGGALWRRDGDHWTAVPTRMIQRALETMKPAELPKP